VKANTPISPYGSPEHASQANWVKFLPLDAYASGRVELMGRVPIAKGTGSVRKKVNFGRGLSKRGEEKG